MGRKNAVTCHLCGGKTKLRFEALELLGGKISVRESPYYKCLQCKEEFTSSEQMQELSELLNQKFSFPRPVIVAGRSLAITLPKDLAAYYGLKKGSKVRLVPETRKRIELLVN